jgi:predicted glutamine amidotransferase
MCRLFALSGGSEPLSATFWLLQAPDSLSDQGRREPDGTGLGWFDERDRPVISKQPLAADEDATFAREAQVVRSRTFVAHVRYATTGALEVRNTHPFELDGRIFAHNGMVGDLPALERELGPALSGVRGDTDSERLFALITKEIERLGGVGDGIASAVGWVAANLQMLALNLIISDANDLWALRYPEVHDLFVLERTAGGHVLDHSRGGRLRARAPELADRDAVVIATERMDDDPGWREIPSGELIHVDSSLTVSRRRILDGPPAHPLSLSDLEGRAAAAQSA